MRRAIPQQLSGQRAKAERVFSVVKRKLSARAPGRCMEMQARQAALLGVSYNINRLQVLLHRKDVNETECIRCCRASNDRNSRRSGAVDDKGFEQVIGRQGT
jgi:hypothetical protein